MLFAPLYADTSVTLISYHPVSYDMGRKTEVPIGFGDELLNDLDRIAEEQFGENRSKAVRHAVRELIQKYGDEYGAQEAQE